MLCVKVSWINPLACTCSLNMRFWVDPLISLLLVFKFGRHGITEGSTQSVGHLWLRLTLLVPFFLSVSWTLSHFIRFSFFMGMMREQRFPPLCLSQDRSYLCVLPKFFHFLVFPLTTTDLVDATLLQGWLRLVDSDVWKWLTIRQTTRHSTHRHSNQHTHTLSFLVPQSITH